MSAKHIACTLGCLDERFLADDEGSGEAARSDFVAQLAGIPGGNTDLRAMFPCGVAFHHAGVWGPLDTHANHFRMGLSRLASQNCVCRLAHPSHFLCLKDLQC